MENTRIKRNLSTTETETSSEPGLRENSIIPNNSEKFFVTIHLHQIYLQHNHNRHNNSLDNRLVLLLHLLEVELTLIIKPLIRPFLGVWMLRIAIRLRLIQKERAAPVVVIKLMVLERGALVNCSWYLIKGEQETASITNN